MRRIRLTSSGRQNLLRQIDITIQLDKRKRRLYNKKFRRSLIFIAAWVVRVIYLSLYILILTLYERSSGYENELVLERNVESYKVYSRQGSYWVTELNFRTNHDRYCSKFRDSGAPAFKINDTLMIERNIFGKPIYFTKDSWPLKYSIDLSSLLYSLILFLTLVSMGFNDGLDRITKRILHITWIIDALAIFFFFLT